MDNQVNKIEKIDTEDEKFLLQANEQMLSSKGFILYTVTEKGDVNVLGNTKNLSFSETLGLYTYIREISDQTITNVTDINDYDDEEDNLNCD
jgi:hypothetical protein